MFFSEKEIYKRYQSNIKGNEILRIGIAIAIFDNKKRLLLEKRSDCGWWGIPGGGLEIGETIEDCVFRETYEEFGIKLKKKGLRLFNIYSNPKEYRIVQYPDNRIHLVDFIYTYNDEIGEITLSDESLDYGFYNRQNIPKFIVPPSIEPLNELFKL